MKVVFMGTPQFAVVSLKKLLMENVNIVSVVTAPDKQKGRGLKVQSSSVKTEAIKHNIPVLQPEKLNHPEFRQQLKALKPDLFVVVAFRILPESIFSMPPLGTVNLHGSLLPKYRGAAPINWAIINGEKETGVTTIFINKKVDTGNIIDSKKISISGNMTAGELHDQMAEIGAELLYKTCTEIQNNSFTTTRQDESLVSSAPKIKKEMCRIDFKQSSVKVHNFIRGLSPFPGAFSYYENKYVKLFDSKVFEISNKNEISSGSIIDIKQDKIIIQCLYSSISIGKIQFEGKSKIDVESFLKGNSLKIYSKFG